MDELTGQLRIDRAVVLIVDQGLEAVIERVRDRGDGLFSKRRP
jgi:hypothetical protein